MLTASILVVTAIVLFVFAAYRVPIGWWGSLLFFVSALLWHGGAVVEDRSSSSTFLLGTVLLLAVLFAVFSIPWFRRLLLVRPVYATIKRRLSRLSEIERQALEGSVAGFERGFFSGHPDWEELRALPKIQLTKEEKEFFDGPAEELCRMIDDWKIRREHRKIPEYIWDFSKKHKFLGLRASREYGGLSFSFQAQSIILGKIASRSLDTSTIVGVSNSLGPNELIEKYGTQEQKDTYLPRLALGQEIPAFAITSPTGGTDVAAMRDVGYVTYGYHDGKKTLGIRLTWDKRYITFAPDATLIVLAFYLFDPDDLLKQGKDIGITLALVPSRHHGVRIGRRHLVGGAAFPNGPIWGKDVFIPLDWIIGGTTGAGKGWKMLMECLFVGRGVSLPSMSVASVKAMLRYSTAYARVRRQFGKPIGMIEGVEEPLARLTEMAYLSESARAVTAAMVDCGQRPIAIASLMKYQTTEYARRAINEAMDIHGGRAICDGPSNYLQATYQMAPVGISVEGTNIVTRSLITFAQGILGSHPYFFREMDSCSDLDQRHGLAVFETAFLAHISFFPSNICRSFFHNITGGIFGYAPKGIPRGVAKWYRQLWRYSTSFALVADTTAVFLGGRLKKKQKLGGRLADALSELYFLSCALKRYEDDGFPTSDLSIVRLCTINGLYRLQYALAGVVRNFPNAFMRLLLTSVVFPFGARRVPAADDLSHEVAALMIESGESRDRLTRYIYVSNSRNDSAGILEIAFRKHVEVEPALKKLDWAVRSRVIRRYHGADWIGEAERKGVLTKEEAAAVREAEALAEQVIAVDDFDSDNAASHTY